MRQTLRLLLVSAGFWFCVVLIGGLVAVIHGDCFADQQCIAEKRWITIGTLAIGAVAYIVLLVTLKPWKIEGDSD